MNGFTQSGAALTKSSHFWRKLRLFRKKLLENRAKNFGMIGAAFGLGFIIGPMIGGLLGGFGPRIPFYAAAILALLNCLYGLFRNAPSCAACSRPDAA